METLTPAQRVATITIGLVLTALVVIWVLPWAGDQIAARLPPTRTPTTIFATPTPSPAATPTQTPGPTPTPTVALTPPPSAVLLEPVPYQVQAPDPCDLSPLGIVLTYWGYTDTHAIITPLICPGELDTGAAPEELGDYARSRGLEAHVGVNGRADTLRQLLANGLPVIVPRWIANADGTGSRRYQAIRGYDQVAGTFTVHDLLAGPDVTVPYQDMEEGWQAFNRQYILIYLPDHQDRVRAILGDTWDEKTMWQGALEQAKRELRTGAQAAEAQAAFNWMNAGSALVALEEYDKAREAFDSAQQAGLPSRLLWYQFALYKCLLAGEDYEGLLALTQKAIDAGAAVEEIHFYRARAYVALNNAAQARAEYARALEIHPEWLPARDGLNALPQ